MKSTTQEVQNIDKMHNQGVALYDRKKYAEAAEIFSAIIRIKQDHLPSIERLAAIARELGNTDTAINLFQAIVDIAPTYAIGYCNLAHALRDVNRTDEAQKCFEKAAMFAPDDEVTIKMMGTLALAMGDKEKAGEFYLKAYKLNPKDYASLGSYIMHLHKVTDKDDEYFQALHRLKKKADKEDNLPRKMSFYQAYAKAFKDMGDADAEFKYIQEAVKIKRATFNYNVRSDLKMFEETKKIFTAELVGKYKDHAIADDAPIFVIGMPRSGSTLTDQILCSHKDITSIGEADILGPIIRRHLHIQGVKLPIRATAQRKLSPAGVMKNYLKDAQKMAGNVPHFVDKSLLNYPWIGVIRAAMPNAKIIHIKRNPMDCCLSCYTNIFVDSNHAYTYDLKDLGQIYRAYADMMKHWHEQFPGAILDVAYEDLVADTEGQTRRMLDYIGLPWDDNCLQFYDTKRQVRTASISQVRQPIYKSSVEKWHAYEKHLEPLAEALGPYGPAEKKS